MKPSQPSQPAPAGAPVKIGQAGTWFQLSPFGTFRGANSVHVFDQGAAAMLVAAFERAKAGNRIPRGLPIYLGDPEADPKANPDRRKYGSILALTVRGDGLYAQARWSKAGRDILANEHFDYVAPHWQTEPLPGKPGSVRPVALVSAGLTNWPPASDARPLAANTGEPFAPSLSSVPTTAANTRESMNHAPASNAFWQLVYQRMMATQESQEKAFANCKAMHPETFAAYEKETAESVEVTTAANEAAAAAKTKAKEERLTRMANVKEAVDALLREKPWMEYDKAYNAVKREKPELFAVLRPSASNV